MEAGVLEQALLKADRSGAVLVLDVPDAAAAQAAVDSLPLVRHGVTRFDLTELWRCPTPPDRRRTGAAAGTASRKIGASAAAPPGQEGSPRSHTRGPPDWA